MSSITIIEDPGHARANRRILRASTGIFGTFLPLILTR